jgi:hemolysin activation/secretion protein
MSNLKLVTVALLALSQSAFAQTPPSAGGQLQQIPPAPVLQRDLPEIRIQQGGAPVIPALDSVRIIVRSLNVTGQTLYSEAELVAITGFSPGNELALADLRGMATKISDYYHRNGYIVV